MTPWDILGWGVIVIIAIIVTIFVANLLWALAQDIHAAIVQRRAHRGKVRCQAAGDCNNPAVYQTPIGYFCDYHRTGNSTKKTLHGSVSWSTLLDWAKE